MTDLREKLADVICSNRAVDNWQATPSDYDLADAIIAALPDMVQPLVWEDFEGRGAKAKAWGKANYLITKWSDGRFELVESYPGYQGDNLAGGFCDTLEDAKAAAQAHHVAQIMAALGMGVE